MGFIDIMNLITTGFTIMRNEIGLIKRDKGYVYFLCFITTALFLSGAWFYSNGDNSTAGGWYMGLCVIPLPFILALSVSLFSRIEQQRLLEAINSESESDLEVVLDKLRKYGAEVTVDNLGPLGPMCDNINVKNVGSTVAFPSDVCLPEHTITIYNDDESVVVLADTLVVRGLKVTNGRVLNTGSLQLFKGEYFILRGVLGPVFVPKNIKCDEIRLVACEQVGELTTYLNSKVLDVRGSNLRDKRIPNFLYTERLLMGDTTEFDVAY